MNTTHPIQIAHKLGVSDLVAQACDDFRAAPTHRNLPFLVLMAGQATEHGQSEKTKAKNPRTSL
ncbi:hypothetical protein [Quatrionicoccus australiensis]|uniref:hypothetical protein n=1 Tax=Quatrionicoccus australiensis TaxID=138118 RepID=UPI001CF8B54C|nr:hypothetical protein [Quatrionicoccus australiensis]UCV16729.1 hypothetical protein KI612_08700 [Quatrionicoccus australiensis]